MWRNTVVVEFIEWLRAYNDALQPGAEKVEFYGLDLYSLHASMKAVLQYLEKVDPRRPSGHASVTPASTMSARIPRPMV
jgi:erythromycin esterase-like protein